jgi:hypothetical protein
LQLYRINAESGAQAFGEKEIIFTVDLRGVTLVPDLKAFLRRGRLKIGHARAIARFPSTEQETIARETMG